MTETGEPGDRIPPEQAAAEADQRIGRALHYASEYAYIDGDHHKMWVIDQMVRALTGCLMVTKSATDVRGKPYTYEAQGESLEYLEWIRADNEDCGWDAGIAP